MSWTTVVDEIFKPNFNGIVCGTMGIYDGTLEVLSVYRYNEYDTEEFIDKLVSEAKKSPSDEIFFRNNGVDRFQDQLMSYGFDVSIDVERDRRGRVESETLYATLEI